jgi:hypothetical protein
VFDMIPAKTTAKVSSGRGAPSTMSRSPAPMRPLPSATAIPSIATSTVPSGAKPVKLPTMFVMIRCSPSIVSRLTGWTVCFVPG